MRRSRVRLLVAAPLLFGKAIKRLLQGKKRKGLVLLYGKDWAYSVLNRENTGGIPERSKGSDCKSDGYAFEGSNPSPATMFYYEIACRKIKKCAEEFGARVWFNGRTSAFQAEDAGSIPATRSSFKALFRKYGFWHLESLLT